MDFASSLHLDANILNHVWLHLITTLVLWILVIFAIILDLWDGVNTARKLNQRIHSHKLRVTVDKISEYWRFMLIAFIVDSIGILFPFYSLPFISIVFCIGLVGVEAKSMFEHAKKRKSKALEMSSVIASIINAVNDHDAKLAVEKMKAYLESHESLET